MSAIGSNLNAESFDDLELPGSEIECNLPVKDKSPNEFIEKAHEQKELNIEASKSQRWEHRPDWAENEEARKINPMHYMEFVNKLRLHGILIEPNNFTALGRIGLQACPHGVWKYITTLQYPYSYEYSVMRFNEYRVPTNEKFRGWRTALLHLIGAGVLSKEKALEIFGPPQGPAAETYLKELALL